MNDILSTYDLRVVCATCAIKASEISYTLQSVVHQCAKNLLLGRAKGASKWRPISRRPEFPRPSKYEVCWHFVEGSGCTKHQHRCTFARSMEEAAVWNFERQQGLDHTRLCTSIDETESDHFGHAVGGQSQFESLDDILKCFDLKGACSLCSVKESEITYTIQKVSHTCQQFLFLARLKGSDIWRPVAERPAGMKSGPHMVYQVCSYFKEDHGCSRDGSNCTFARSREEACLWNFAKKKNMDNDTILQCLNDGHSTTPEDTARNIIKEFSGEFLELCQDCFLGSPQKLTVQGCAGTCSAEPPGEHTWKPILVHHVSEHRGKEVYHKVRPLPPGCTFEYCHHVSQGKPCWHEASRCHMAHSEVEMAVWRAESGKLHASFRPQLLQLSLEQQRHQQSDGGAAAFYCKACLITLSSEERFLEHCATPEHAQIIHADTSTQWETRPPPHNHREDFRLCAMPNTCEYGDNCVQAHSQKELREWQMRTEEGKEMRANIEAQSLMSYAESLCAEYRSNEANNVLSEHLEDVIVTCEEELFVECEESNVKFQWNFQVTTERLLKHVALLMNQSGASFSLKDMTAERVCSYSFGKKFQNTDIQTYNITVFFASAVPGLYEQWLVLDFDMRPVLLRIVKVRVGSQSTALTEEATGSCPASHQPLESWQQDNRIIIPCVDRTEAQDDLLRKYPPPKTSFALHPVGDSQTLLNAESYGEKMHNFLFREELAENELVSRISVRGEMTTSKNMQAKHSGSVIANQGALFCTFLAPFNLTPDTPEGCALKRSIQSGLIAPLSTTDHGSKVYEAIILKTTAKNKIHCKLSKRCCSELQLKDGETYQMELQFQLDRLSFCEMHKAIDRLPNTKIVLPDLDNCEVPSTNSTPCHRLNVKQQAAVDFIIGKSSSRKGVAPLLIYGPFGTGKTFTLAAAARELTRDPQNKVLICSHTNSSADLYVKDHFHSFIIEGDHAIKPIRIKANNDFSMVATDETTLKYCLLSKCGNYFVSPTKNALDSHRIIITTTTMAKRFHDLNLPKGYFTHILIDEASQMLECEALIPLGLAGPNTRVVLAGDHMQMGPKLFSVDDHQRSNYTLLTRLFHYYHGQNSEVAEKSRIIFNENYRSTKEIVEFVSAHFYVGKCGMIKSDKTVPAEPNDHSLKFHHVRGDCKLDTVSMSWWNNAEVAKVVEIVEDILRQWPVSWGRRDHRSICVLSEGWQVRKIRTALWRKDLENVNVENFTNVQGKEFRAVIITSVQTRESLTTAHLPGMELFNDARVLNTAMTRAQSLVVVVGDATALCCFGKCSRIWKSYIDHCISKNSLEPTLENLKDFFEHEIEEMSRFQKPLDFESCNARDVILQQLRKEYEQCETDSDEEDLDCGPNDGVTRSQPNTADKSYLQLCKSQPEMYKHGQLVLESSYSGYVIPFDNPTKHIHLKGRNNLGHAANGDEVVVEISVSDGFEQHIVLDILNRADSNNVFVCTMDHPEPYKQNEQYTAKSSKNDPKSHRKARKPPRMIMVPIARKSPKICILIKGDNWKRLPVWKHYPPCTWEINTYHNIDEHLTQKVFMVQVICWKKGYSFPLGKVIDIIPIGRSADDALKILKKEFKVNTVDSSCRLDTVGRDTACDNRKNLCGVITFTVDPITAKNLDDAISISNEGNTFEVGVHIADVASFVSPGCRLDETARQMGATYYTGQKKPHHMYPEDLNKECSLLPGKERKVVSFMVKVNKETNEIIGKPNFLLSYIKSDRKMSYEEAEEIICKKTGSDEFDRCVKMAYHFAKAQRKIRKPVWANAQNNEGQVPGKRKAHLMIEELNVLFNTKASEMLINTEKTELCTPLRCQAKPDHEQMKLIKERYGQLVPLSFHLRNQGGHDQQVAECLTNKKVIQPAVSNSFHVLTKVWNDIKVAAREGSDIDKVVDLIAADDTHPQLMPVLIEYQECLSKAYFIRSNSSSKAIVGHYSLNLSSYTQASSPIRRYIDIVLQRLLHSVICGTLVDYSQREIDLMCQQFELAMKTATEYKNKAETINLGLNIKKHNVSKLAIMLNSDQGKEYLRFCFPYDKDVFPGGLPITLTDLHLADQPIYDEKCLCLTLKWKKRVYTFPNQKVCQKVRRIQNSDYCTEIPASTWKAIVEAVENENWPEMRSLIMGAKTKQVAHPWIPKTGKVSDLAPCTMDEQHYTDFEVQLKPGDILLLQITSEVVRGHLTPTVQLMFLNDHMEICIDHEHSPITSFSKYALSRTTAKYNNTKEYIAVWKPLCEMEAAETAVRDGDSIIIKDIVVNFQKDGGHLKGSFTLPLTQIKEWAIECSLANCLLCIRKSGLKPVASQSLSKDLDPNSYTWVAHGVTEHVKEEKNKKKVYFNVNHLPMEIVPDCVFQIDTHFTVELIPKILPDIRKLSAVLNIPSASHLVERIALGKPIPREVMHEAVQKPVRQHEFKSLEPPKGLPKLNEGQFLALEAALSTNFTLIQGPPGTGKTVLGGYIVFWLNTQNTRNIRRNIDSTEQEKKQVILYCGPSNKSVDVVAEKLLKFESKLRPLRVYSQQVETLEYPYTGSSLQLSRSALREESSKPQLRSITLHHLMREDHNPESQNIKVYDEKIKKGDRLTNAEVDEYKSCLRKARDFEFKQHDIILCTCTVSSSPGLTRAVSARQIIIDECAMATEPQTLIPLVCNKPEKVILIGDHKQLCPVITNRHVGNLGMSRSLFERYYTMQREIVIMLDTQYRMHEEICQFPSKAYYDNSLKTAVDPTNSCLRIDKKLKTIVFGHIIGEEISLLVSTKKGNENSKANMAEQNRAVDIAQSLVMKAKVEQESIVILSPYNAQVSGIKHLLQKRNLSQITVCTISKSQGSEWRYVILSTVRSLPTEEIRRDPDRGWRSKHLGFVGDPNQINVGITRAKEGLCIIGNEELLDCSPAWHKLLEHYRGQGSVTSADHITVANIKK